MPMHHLAVAALATCPSYGVRSARIVRHETSQNDAAVSPITAIESKENFFRAASHHFFLSLQSRNGLILGIE
jgi:hypothetical protein